MRIDSVSPKPDRAGRYLVKLSSGAVLRLYRQTVEDFGLFPGLELREDQMDALRESAGAFSAKMRAVRIVSAANVSKKDLEQRLVQKGEDPTQAHEAVEWMEELKLVDDRETAAQLVASCVHKGYGPARARQTLYEKKIPRELWEEALADYPDQTAYMIKFIKSRLKDSHDPRQKRRVVDALVRRGHGFSQIRQAMDLAGAEPGEDSEVL